MEIFRAENIVKHYAQHTALKKVSINVPSQSIYGLLGPNGAGKTSLIRIINQITSPDEGVLFFKNEKLQPKHISLIGYLPEERGLYKKMKVGEQALYLAQLKGLKKSEALPKLKYWFERFEIQTWWNRKVEELSKGMQQKVQFIVTILHKPELLIFDEPFSGFDPINANIIKDEILELRKNGATIIFSTHNMSSVEELCDHITLINKSKSILEGSVKEIRDTYKTNTFQIEAHGDETTLKSALNGRFELVECNTEHDFLKAKISIKDQLSPNDLLNTLLPYIQLNLFKEVIPSMNDIFIRCVENDVQTESD